MSTPCFSRPEPCSRQDLIKRCADETEAIDVLEQRLHKAPSLSISQLKDKIFGSFSSDTEFRLVMHAAAPLYSESFDADAALAKSLKTVYTADSHSKSTRRRFAELMTSDELYSENEKYFDYRGSLHRIEAKTLIIVGERDWICPPSQSRIMAAIIPQARLVVFAGANHGVHIEKNREVVATIRDWLDNP